MTAGPWARFDDLQAGDAITFPTVDRELVADRAEDVVPVLDEVERACNAGRWAFGYVAYEAASGLDPSLAVRAAPADGLPLVWFGLSDAPIPTRPLDAAVFTSMGPVPELPRTVLPLPTRRAGSRAGRRLSTTRTSPGCGSGSRVATPTSAT